MIDIVVNEKKPESRAEKLEKKYVKVNGVDWEMLMALRDISVTMAMIYDKLNERGCNDVVGC